ncbi:RagB/SusD family nutrient uptake outer membrane protein [Pseudoflavitalea rhizosphaerae]|uniref:RagB/SusD family nutrient uptake outer membrane protein n=1 Tax=Pseudoflavitalea rhizosphaerae TaxID=1884793 RepID=UPI000F8C4879|nr:RagB/SusD family nutrient uptake outer membrane protein [Pseudoflavitalea rhizosphaerae]
MKNYIAPVFLLLIAGISCNKDFLEVLPKGKVIAVNYKDYELMLNNTNLQNTGTDAQLLLGDEVTAEEPYYSGLTLREQRLFSWSAQVYQPDEEGPETNGPLSAIYTYNKIIREVMDAPDGTAEQKKMVLAEALAGRAWTYFLLINYYGKPYLKSTAASDPGFPIISTADITVNHFTRATVQEVYDLITTDLQKAIPDLSPTVFHRLRMSRPAAQALLGKVYVFMQRFDEALPLLESAMQGLATAQAPVRLYNYNETFAPDGIFMPLSIFGPNYPVTSNNEEVMYLRQFSNFHTLFNTLQVNSATMELYEPSDLRLLLYAKEPFPTGAAFQAGAHRRTAPGIVPFGVGVPELYLLLAECQARLNDLDGAQTTLKALRSNRMPPTDAALPGAVAGNRQLLLEFVLEERLREFAGLGYRWFDMRRLSVDPLFPTHAYTHTLRLPDGNFTEYNLDPKRFVLRIPPKILLANPGMEDNP